MWKRTLGFLVCATVLGFAVPEARSDDREAVIKGYLEIAFGNGPINQTHLLQKRPDTSVNVGLAMGDTTLDTPGELDLLQTDIVSVLQDMRQHNSHFQYKYYDADAILAVQRSTKSDIATFFGNIISIYIGTPKEIDMITAKQESAGIPVRQTFEAVTKQFPSEPLCFGVSFGEGGSPFAGYSTAYVELSTNNDQILRCMYRLSMRAFGLPGSPDPSVASIFSPSPATRIAVPSDLDWAIWKLQLDPRLEEGMDAVRAKAAAEDILSELE